MHSIAFKNARFSLEGKMIFDDLSITIQEGEFVGVFGPNGAGKTTLFRLILGLEHLQKGSLFVNDRPTRKGNLEIGYMPQLRNNNLTFPLSGREFLNATLKGSRWGMPWLNCQEQAQINKVIELVGIQEFIDRPCSECSGGERQRLALAQALLGDPKILLLDEPLNNLDPTQQEKIVDLIHSIQKKLGITTLFIAHDVNPLIDVMDKVIYMGNGKVAVGSVKDVVTSETLSKLYNTQIEVIQSKKGVFVINPHGGILNEHHP